MGRPRRQFSRSGYYHIVLRAVNKQQIFLEKRDEDYLIGTLYHVFQDFNSVVCAYALMGNHIHLLAFIPNNCISELMHVFGTSFVRWYNKKYNRVGPLFQGRFFSSTIDNRASFARVLRYILQNPYRAGLEQMPGTTYAQSSFFAYLGQPDRLTNTAPAWELFEDHDALLDYLRTPATAKEIMDCRKACDIDDELIWQLFTELGGVHNTTEFQHLPLESQKALLLEAKSHRAPSTSLSRLTGLSLSQIYRITKRVSETT